MLRKLATGALAAGCAVLWIAPLSAAEEQPGRYTMSPTEGGVVRLDRETGAMSFCTGKDGDWACAPMPDRQQALEGRISELEAENRTLRAEKTLPSPVAPQAVLPPPVTEGVPPVAGDPPRPPADLPLPDEKDVDKLFDYVEGMMKKVKERIKRLEQEAQKEPATPL